MKIAVAHAVLALFPTDSRDDLAARIARRAWELWLNDQRQADHEAEIWIEAERQILAGDSLAKNKAAAHAFASARVKTPNAAEAA
jgi:sigma54-dependent transcription regulator